MAKSEQQRQKKLAKKRSKDLRNRQEMARRNQSMNSIAGQMQHASRFPVHSCFVSEEGGGTSGMRTVFLTRSMSDGRLAFMFALIDLHCLGVKDAGCRFCTPAEFRQYLERSSGHCDFIPRSPSYAKKLTDQAVAYAQSIGFGPHSDYRKVSPLWGDIDASQCDEEFEFGLDGQPSFFAGPFDDKARQNFIFNRLCETVGEGNFHFTLPFSDDAFDGGEFPGRPHFGFDSFAVSDDDETDDDDELNDEDDDENHWGDSSGVIDGTVISSTRRVDGPK